MSPIHLTLFQRAGCDAKLVGRGFVELDRLGDVVTREDIPTRAHRQPLLEAMDVAPQLDVGDRSLPLLR